MSNVLQNLVGALIPKQSYTVGGKSSGNNIPVELTLKLDPDFKKTVIKGATILSIGIGLGIASGIVISNNNKRKKS
jgi:hypothetical protein